MSSNENVEDNTTVANDPKASGAPTNNGYTEKNPGPRRAGDGYGKSDRKIGNDFVATVDYTVEERPFFVPIGKDGVIAALEKLDQQLLKVTENNSNTLGESPLTMTLHSLRETNFCLPRYVLALQSSLELCLISVVSCTMDWFRNYARTTRSYQSWVRVSLTIYKDN